MRFQEIHFRQALISMSTDQNSAVRSNCEAYIEAVIQDRENLIENFEAIVALFEDKSVSTLILIILKKMIKYVKNLDEPQAASLFNKTFVSIKTTVRESEFPLFIDFLVQFLTNIFSATSLITTSFLNEMAQQLTNQFVVSADNQTVIFTLMFFAEYLRYVDSITIQFNLLHKEILESRRSLFYSLKNVIDHVGFLTLIARNAQRTVKLCIKVLRRLTGLYSDLFFLKSMTESVFIPEFTRITESGSLNEFSQETLIRISKVYYKLYITIVRDSHFTAVLLNAYLHVFLREYDPQHLLKDLYKTRLYHLNLRIFVHLIEDFAISGDFSLSVGPANGVNTTLEETLKAMFPFSLVSSIRAFQVFLPEHLKEFGGAAVSLSSHLEYEKRDFNENPFKCASDFACKLFNFYHQVLPEQTETLLRTYAESFSHLMADGTNWENNPQFYCHLAFVESNLFTILSITNVDFIAEKIMNLPPERFNYQLISYLLSFFQQQDIQVDVVQKGSVFFEVYHPLVENSCFRYQLMMGLLTVYYKTVYDDQGNLKINLRQLMTSYGKLLRDCTEEQTGNLPGLITLLSEIIKCVGDDYSLVDDFVITLNMVIDLKGLDPDLEVELVQRTADTFADLFLQVPKNYITLQLLEGCYRYLNKVYEKFKVSQNVAYLASLARLFVIFLVKLELLFDILITKCNDCPETEMGTAAAVQFCKSILVAIELICVELLPQYAENLMTKEVVITLFACANSFNKLFILLNWKVLKPKVKLGNTAIDVEVIVPGQPKLYSNLHESKSEVSFVWNEGSDSTVIRGFVKVLNHWANHAINSEDIDLFVGVLNVVEYLSMCFPFLLEEVCDLVIFAFNAVEKIETGGFKEERPLIFSSVVRITARVLLCCPRSLVSEKLISYSRVINFLKRARFDGTLQETLAFGVLILEYLNGLVANRDEDFLKMFAELSLKEGAQTNNTQLRVLVSLNVLEMIIKNLGSQKFTARKLVWENIRHTLDSAEGYSTIGEVWSNTFESQVDIVCSEREVLTENNFKQAVLAACQNLASQGMISKDHGILKYLVFE